MTVTGHHNVGGVNVTVDIACIVQRHQTCKDASYHLDGETIDILPVVIVQFLCILNHLPLTIQKFTLQHIVQRNAFEQFAHHMVMLNTLTQHILGLCLDEAQHFNEVVVAYLDGSLAPGSFYSTVGQVIIHEFDGHLARHSASFIHTTSFIDLTHATDTQRFRFGVELIVKAMLCLCSAL